MHCTITIGKQLEPSWSAWFDGLTITNSENGLAVLSGLIADQAALHGVLSKLRDLSMPLIDVHCDEVDTKGGVSPSSEGSV